MPYLRQKIRGLAYSFSVHLLLLSSLRRAIIYQTRAYKVQLAHSMSHAYTFTAADLAVQIEWAAAWAMGKLADFCCSNLFLFKLISHLV